MLAKQFASSSRALAKPLHRAPANTGEVDEEDGKDIADDFLPRVRTGRPSIRGATGPMVPT